MRSSRWPLKVTRYCIGAILIITAILKTTELAIRPVPEIDFLSRRWLITALIQFELLLGLWLFFGFARRECCFVTVVTFFLFALVSLSRAIGGEASCGCFGSVQVSPWITFGIDMTLVGLLFATRKDWLTRKELGVPVSRPLQMASVYLCCGVPLLVWIASYSPSTLSANGMIVGQGDLVLLEPEQWIEQSWPLAQHIDGADVLQHGLWTVVLYHHDCPKCLAVMQRYEQTMDALAGNKAGRIALVEIPPYGPATFKSSRMVWLRLSDRYDWFVSTPTEISLDEGVVTRVGIRE